MPEWQISLICPIKTNEILFRKIEKRGTFSTVVINYEVVNYSKNYI